MPLTPPRGSQHFYSPNNINWPENNPTFIANVFFMIQSDFFVLFTKHFNSRKY